MIEPEEGAISETEAATLITMNGVFGGLFVVGLIVTTVLIVRREINDLFLRYSLLCLILAMALSSIMCFVISSYKSYEYIDNQTVPFQQMYFEVPFYMFLIVVTSILFSWWEAYEMYYVQCLDDDENQVLAFPPSPSEVNARASVVSLDRMQTPVNYGRD